jgi:class III poly(R)-hydroxyalkanoic acid synthase PhaE subunit
MSDDWLSLQQKYWEQWTDLSRKAMGADLPQTSPWENALTHWWKAMAPAAPEMSRDFMERMMEQGKMFFRMADSFTRNLPKPGEMGEDALHSVSTALDEMQKAFTGSLGEGDGAMNKMMAFWELPYDNWQRMASSLSPMPGDLLRNMPHDQVKESLNRILSAPGLGYAREEQSQYQDLIRRTMDYQRTLQEYLSFFSHLGVKATERMRDTLMGMRESDQTIDSARTLYDTWVGCCEQVYADEVSTAEYARIHGELVNAQMAFKQRLSVIVDEALGALNMPTRSELRTLQDRVQETRRENKALRRELDELKKRLSGGASAPAPAGALARPAAAAEAPATAAKKAAPRRKTTAVKRTAAAKKSAAKSAEN